MSATATTHQPAAAPRLALLLVVSLLLHLLLLWLLDTPSRITASPGPLHVSLIDTRSNPPAKATSAISPRLPPQSTALTPQQGRNTSLATTGQAVAEDAAESSEPIEWSGGTSERALYDMGQSAEYHAARHTEVDGAALRTQIATRFAEHFHYPALAQQRNWQGTVVLSFRVEADGTLSTVEVVESSGFGLLDKAAIESLRAIGRIEFAPGAVLQRTLELQLPVVYHLAQG